AEDGTVLHPPVLPVFWSFRVMVGTGLMMLAISWFAAWELWRTRKTGGKLGNWPLFALVLMTPSGWVATLAGWYVTEIGRQPWLVSGVLTTADAVGPVSGMVIAGSLTAYLLVYAGLLAAYVGAVVYLAKKASGDDPGPDREPVADEPVTGHPAAAFVPAE
ncbi:MAG: cytochrome ubiquinol oxidase subunit I, partial [Pseudomonadota bacterium]